MKYDNVSPVFSMNFKKTHRANPALIVGRADTNTQLLTQSGYTTLVPDTPHLMLNEKTLRPQGLRCDAARSLVAGNTIQTLNASNVPVNSVYFLGVGEQGSFAAVADGYENGIYYRDYRIASQMTRGYFDFYPFGIVDNIGSASTFSVYVKKVSGNLDGIDLYLINRTQVRSQNIFDDQPSEIINLNNTAGTDLIRNRLISTKKNPLLAGYTQAQLLSTCIFIPFGTKPIDGVIRIGHPQWEYGTNATSPIQAGVGVTPTRAATKYVVRDLPSFGDCGTLVFSFICSETEAAWQDVLLLSDQLEGFTKAIGVSIENTEYLNFGIASQRFRTAKVPAGTKCNVAISWGQGVSMIAFNGSIIYSTEVDARLTPKSLQLGATINATTSASHFTGCIGEVAVYPKQLSANAMIALTT